MCNINTKGLGAGSYPEPNEEKCFEFQFNATIKGYGYVYAKNEEQAKELINNYEYDEIVETFDMEIEEITNLKVEK